MPEKRIIAVGDIHGCNDKLEILLERIAWDSNSDDILIFLGDYIDRGPESFQVVETILGLAEKSENVICLCGNHEQMFLDFISGKIELDDRLISNGIAETITSYAKVNNGFPKKHLQFYKNLKLYYETETYIFVHAGLRNGLTLGQQKKSDLLWLRDDFIDKKHSFGKTIVFGHTPFKVPYFREGLIGLDTGAVYGGPLTAMVFPEQKLLLVLSFVLTFLFLAYLFPIFFPIFQFR